MNPARTAVAVLVLALTACKAAAPEAPAPAAAAATPAAATAPAANVQAAPPAVPASAQPAKPAVQLPADACVKSEDGFAAFFEQFVYEAPVRAAYSAPTVEVRDIKDPARRIEAPPGPFRIALIDNQWSYDEPDKDPSELDRIQIKRSLSGDRMRVDFVRAEFSPDEEVSKTLGKPEAYVFEFKQGCWQLTQQLR